MSNQPCPRCGEPLPDNAHFCPNCGAPVHLTPAAERKVVTVVFADLVSSTSLAASLDPERFREVLAAFHSMVAEEIGALRGQAESYIGDAVLSVFGVPFAHDDDALRAIRAGLAIVDHAERLGKELGLATPLRVRVGINTGPVAVGRAEDRNLVLGAEVNLAARLQQAAEPGEVLVGPTTRQLAADTVEFGDPRTIDAKGFEDTVLAWPVVKLASRSSRQSIPMVDRRRESALLSDTFARVSERSRAHLVTLLGEPGIGKSRVVEEFLAQLEPDVKVLSGRATPFDEGAFGSVAQMILPEIGRELGDPPEAIAASLREVVSGWIEGEAGERAASRLGIVLGLDDEPADEHRYRVVEVRRGLLAAIQALTVRGPAVMVFEDLQDADPVLLDLIEALVKEARRSPLMVVCVARWEFLEKRPGWAGGLADAVTLWVEPLTPADATQLALEAGDFDDEADAERVARHAGGNPFFIVEITGMLLHHEDLPPSGAPSSRLLPPTVQAVITERIDSLSAPARELARRASVFPRGAFDVSELAIIDDPRQELLDELEAEELLVRDEERPTVWRFRSDVLRDVAYESLAKRERQRLHLRVANKLAEPDSVERNPRAIAFHLEQAARAALDLDPRDRTLAERAVEALARAGDLARRRVESRAAADLYERALAMAGPEGSWGDREAWILSALGEARYWLGEFDASESSLVRALELAGDVATVIAQASRYLADITLTIRGDADRAAELFDQALEAAHALGDPAVLSRTLLMAGWVPYWRNELDAARAMFEEALEVARSAERRDAWAEGRALVGLASVTSPIGDEADALALGEDALVIGRESGQAFTEAVARDTVAGSLRRMGRTAEALDLIDGAIEVFRELGARWELASALGDRGDIHRVDARLDDAEADLREAYRLCRDLNERALVTWTAAELSLILVARGDLGAARSLLDEPSARLASEEPGSLTTLLRAEAALAYAAGDDELARAKAEAAIEAERGDRGAANPLAAQIWWTARLFGDEAAGGPDAVREARDRLERHHWVQALREPDLLTRPA